MRRLSLAALDDLPRSLRPRVDPRAVSIGIVHLGLGAFHRAHQAVSTEDAMAATGSREWGICGVSPCSRGVAGQLVPQDGLYAVLERSAAGTGVRVVGTIREVLVAAEGVEPVLSRLASPAVRVVTLTVTEKAYRLRRSTGGLDVDDPEVAADLAGRPPRTVVGMLARGLERRMRADAGPVSVVCCDNLPGNGALLARMVSDFAERVSGGALFGEWLAGQVTFPATMVDRIVPATVDADRADAARLLGVRDEGTVVAEPFSQWVVEDRFAAARPCWERAGVTLTADVRPYEMMKLRLLNGSHSTLAYLGALAGHEYIADAVRVAELGELVRRLMTEEVRPTLDVPAGFDLDGYVSALLARFADPALRYRTTQVAADGSQKLPQRLLGTARDLLRRGREPRFLALAVAAWMRYVWVRRTDGGADLPVDDPIGDRLASLVAGASGPGDVAAALLGVEEVFGPDLAADPVFAPLVTGALDRLTRDGVVATVPTALAL